MKADNAMLKHECRIDSYGRSQTQQPGPQHPGHYASLYWHIPPPAFKTHKVFSHYSPSCSPSGKVSSPANCFLPCVNLEESFSIPTLLPPETSHEVNMVQKQITPSMSPSPGYWKVKPISERCRGIFTDDENSYILMHK